MSSALENLLKKQPHDSEIKVKRGDKAIKFIVPKYGWKSSDWLVTLYSLFWMLVFGAGVYATFFWLDTATFHEWRTIPVKVVAFIIAVGLLIWIGSEINAFNEQQTLTLNTQEIRIDKHRQFRSAHTAIPLPTIENIDIESYPIIYYDHDNSTFFMESSKENEKVWMVKILKLWIYQMEHRKV